MFTLVYGDDLSEFPHLANQMFRDRRVQFKDALGWNLDVDPLGREIDRYDLLNPLYLILRDENGVHQGSTRLMPTTGPTMIADHFSTLTDGVPIESPLIWECTRFFIARRAKNSRRNAAALMWAGCQMALRSGIEFYVGVTAAQMVRVFHACGWPAEIIGQRSDADGEVCACLWEVTEEICERLRARAGIEGDARDLSVYRRPTSRAPSGVSSSLFVEKPPFAAAGFEPA